MNAPSARAKFACPCCGAEATWNPAKSALICGFCGTTSPANLELSATGEEVIKEHDLLAALRTIPDSARGWKTARTQVRCQSCQAISVFSPERVGQNCDFCGSPALLPYTETKDSFCPESLLEFTISETKVRETLRTWYSSRWFAPNALASRALTDTIRGVYIPYWTFDAQVHADWTAESGYYYYTTEHYTDNAGKRQTRQTRHTRWESSNGSLDHFFDDTLVAASRGVTPELLRKVEPFPMAELKPYHAGFLSGWVVERYQIDLGSAADLARQRMDREMIAFCSRQVPGDTQRNLEVNTDYSGQTFKHTLVPVWLVNYQFHGKTFQVVVNGYTGTIAGNYPRSWIKITLAVLGTLALIGILAFAFSRR